MIFRRTSPAYATRDISLYLSQSVRPSQLLRDDDLLPNSCDNVVEPLQDVGVAVEIEFSSSARSFSVLTAF